MLTAHLYGRIIEELPDGCRRALHSPQNDFVINDFVIFRRRLCVYLRARGGAIDAGRGRSMLTVFYIRIIDSKIIGELPAE